MRLLTPLRVGFAAAVLLAGVGVAWFATRDRGDPRLNAFAHHRPSVPVVFTSRSGEESFLAASPDGEGFTAPGRRPWASTEGRLRIVRPNGTVRELTWNMPLPDGGTLIDVMSPSISLDGERILFAGRRGDGHGRFRLYQVDVDGSNLKQLTGGPDDPGCVALPPIRYREDGSPMPDAERKASDYDDIDPVELNFLDRRIAFVSSRTPDLGRDHDRRSTTLWVLRADGRQEPASANRNNDRWPFLLSSGYLAFSLWSRNRETIPADLGDVRPYTPGSTPPTDAWLGAFTQIPGGHFGMLVKPALPVWRPRPLFANRIAFMTNEPTPGAPLTVMQVDPGLIAAAPSSLTGAMPKANTDGLRRAPTRDDAGRPLWLATPSPCPPEHVLLSAASAAGAVPRPGDYAIAVARHDWPADAATASAIDLKIVFDDPDFVDAEPVAVYPRPFHLNDPSKVAPLYATPPTAGLNLLNGENYRGPMGTMLATNLDRPTQMQSLPGQTTDAGEKPLFASPPAGSIDHLRVYAARRDRFDDPKRERIPGVWELILKIPVKDGVASSWLPADSPTVLAGYDKEGRVVRWTSTAKDAAGQRATTFAFAGDHYSLTVPGGKHFCVGCHPGHSGLSLDTHQHAEKLR